MLSLLVLPERGASLWWRYLERAHVEPSLFSLVLLLVLPDFFLRRSAIEALAAHLRSSSLTFLTSLASVILLPLSSLEELLDLASTSLTASLFHSEVEPRTADAILTLLFSFVRRGMRAIRRSSLSLLLCFLRVPQASSHIQAHRLEWIDTLVHDSRSLLLALTLSANSSVVSMRQSACCRSSLRQLRLKGSLLKWP